MLENKAVGEKIEPSESWLRGLMKKKAPRIPKKSKTASSTTSSTTASESTASSGSGHDEL